MEGFNILLAMLEQHSQRQRSNIAGPAELNVQLNPTVTTEKLLVRREGFRQFPDILRDGFAHNPPANHNP